MKRFQYLSQLRKGEEIAEKFRKAVVRDAEQLRTKNNTLELSVFFSGRTICVYLEQESQADKWNWPSSYQELLERWPGEGEARLVVPMLDIFHDGSPADPISWRGNRRVDERRGAIARLKPDWAASYIFYHYQLQEETPESFNKTYMIGLHGNLLFSYQELPAVISEPKPKGKLSTRNTPGNWHEVMQPHFQPWENAPEGEGLWFNMERIL